MYKYSRSLRPLFKPDFKPISNTIRIVLPKTANLILDGNSLTAYNIYPPMLPSLLKPVYTVRIVNYGVGGQTTAQMLADAASQVDIPLNKDKSYNIVFCWEGINDLYYNATIQQCFDNIKNYCLARRAYGFKVVVGSLTPRTNIGTPADYEQKRLAVNDLIRANYTTFADALVDIGGDANMGVTGASANTTYYEDLVHFTTTGYTIVANLLATAVNGLLA